MEILLGNCSVVHFQLIYWHCYRFYFPIYVKIRFTHIMIGHHFNDSLFIYCDWVKNRPTATYIWLIFQQFIFHTCSESDFLQLINLFIEFIEIISHLTCFFFVEIWNVKDNNNLIVHYYHFSCIVQRERERSLYAQCYVLFNCFLCWYCLWPQPNLTALYL